MTVDPRITDILNRYLNRVQVETKSATSLPETPAPAADVTAALVTLLPRVIAAISRFRTAGKVSIASATTLITDLSGIVATGAPLIKGASARALVIALFTWAFDTYAVPMLPAFLRPFAGFIKSGAIAGLEYAYQTLAKKLTK